MFCAGHMNRLDVRSLLQDDAIEHVEMSEVGDSVGGDKVDTASDQNPDQEEVRWRGGAGLYCDRNANEVCNNRVASAVNHHAKYKYCKL